MPPRPSPRIDYRALAEFRYQIRSFLHASEAAARAGGLEPQQHQLLLAIKGTPPHTLPTIAYLAERLQLKHHSLGGLVDRLVRRRLVRRRRDTRDLRRALITLTRRGEAILHRLSLIHQGELKSRGRALAAAMTAIVRAGRSRA